MQRVCTGTRVIKIAVCSEGLRFGDLKKKLSPLDAFRDTKTVSNLRITLPKNVSSSTETVTISRISSLNPGTIFLGK